MSLYIFDLYLINEYFCLWNKISSATVIWKYDKL
jgi:hypothetical protein